MEIQFDRPKSNCAIFGIWRHPAAAHLTYLGLYAMQHRGQESTGIVSSDRRHLHRHVRMGLVADVFSRPEILNRLKGDIAIGHNRYSTTGSGHFINAQPLLVNSKFGPFAISHNGNLTNSSRLRFELEDQGALFQTSTDTEVIPHLMARSRKDTLAERVRDALGHIHGAYSLVMMTRNHLIGVRDPMGFRPLSLGKKDNAHVLASETCALDLIEAEYVREIEPGEIVVINQEGIASTFLENQAQRHACIFEFIYFARPDSIIFKENVDKVRRKLGKNLALESPAEADFVISVPDSSNTAAIGYTRRTGLKFEIGLIRNHYIGRTFIHPDQSVRDFNVKIKFNTVKGVLNGKRVVVVEDSIVRGTTLKQLVGAIRQAGAREVHIRVSSPPIISPCFYGMDFPTREELIANNMSIEEIKNFIGADSLAYLSMAGLMGSVSTENGGFCTACFDANYPLPPEDRAKSRHEMMAIP